MRIKNILLPIFLFALLNPILLYGNNQEPLIGDESDGSRSIPVHLIPLLDEEGIEILADEEPAIPFSTQKTCAMECHSYDTISSGWHFNYRNPEVDPGRSGHPWIYVDTLTGTQIPLSYRSWPGTYRPDEIGLTPWQFVLRFGRHLPGGGVGEFDETENPDVLMRIFVSGKLEINCLSCHDADPAHDQSEYALQIARQNFRWAAAATSGFTSVAGAAKDMPDTFDHLMPEPPNDPALIPPTLEYRENTLDPKNRVFFNILRKVPNKRCYFCHSQKTINDDKSDQWMQDEDVHLYAGMACVDCHRNGLNHDIIRGYENEYRHTTNPLASISSCEGCHIPSNDFVQPLAGRLTAPVPEHAGIPPVHFEKMTCTSCHSGPWPTSQVAHIKTSLAHGLGIHNVDKSDTALPLISSPVFARTSNGKIAPHNLIWPSFWGKWNEDTITPLSPNVIKPSIDKTMDTENLSIRTWPNFTEKQVTDILADLQTNNEIEGKPIFISQGLLYALDGKGKLISAEHPAAEPYLWPLAHNVRPAAQSLGVRGCEDCHSTDAPIFFAQLQIDSPMSAEREIINLNIDYQNLDPVYMNTFALTFIARPYFKIAMIAVGIVLSLILLLYGLKGIQLIINRLSGTSE